MPKRHQQRPARESHGRNNPKQSTVITTGPHKKKETYEEEAREHKDPFKQAQEAKVHPKKVVPPDVTTKKQDSQAMMEEGEKRSGSDSDASTHRKGSRLHESAQRQPPSHSRSSVDYDQEDLRPDDFTGEDHGMQGQPVEYGLTAYDVKDLYPILADLSNDELKSIPILPLGSVLEQGAKYIDLLHLEQGEFTAMANTVADEEHYYVPKKETDYVIWNRLNQVENPARLDEQE